MNKFKTFALLMGGVLVASMTSCTKGKDGYYFPKKKIARVYYSSTYTDKCLRQSWNWDGKLLKSIDYYSSSGSLSWTADFTYDGKRLERVDDYLNSEYVTYAYDGKYLKAANYYYRGNLEATTAYSYADNKISKMVITYYESKKSMEGRHLFDAMLPFQQEVVEVADKFMVKVAANETAKGLESVIWQFTWDGNNVSKVSLAEEGYMATMTMQYDDKNNPFKGFHDLYTDVDDDGDIIFSLSKNNVTRMIVNASEGGDSYSYITNFTYQYNSDDYPTMRIGRYSDEPDYMFSYYYDYE